MKNYLFPVLLLMGSCTDPMCGPADKKQHMTNTSASKPMTCKLTTPELRQRKATVIAQLKAQVLEKKELPDGYAYKFNGSDEMVNLLTDFIKTERLCCDFFDFNLLVSNDSTAWLTISGEQGAKAFIQTELEL